MKQQRVRYDWQDPKLKDFRSFLFLTWRHLNLPEPTPLQYDVADVLQKAVLKGGARLIVMGFRGMAKSWISSALAVWELYWWPEDNILVESAAKSRADEFSSFCLRLIDEIPQLAALRPTDSQRRRVDSFEVGPAGASHSPSLRAVGITGQRTGSRGDLIMCDDVEVDSNSDTDLQRASLRRSCLENEGIMKPNGAIIYLGTPHTEQTVYKFLEAAGYTIVIWPARYPDARLQKVHGPRLGPMVQRDLARDPSLVGQPTEPTRFTHDDLLTRESKGRSWFALQFMLDTSLADAVRHPLWLSDLIVDDLDVRSGAGGYAWSGSPDYELKGVPSPGFDGDHFHRPWQRLGNAQPWQGVIVQVDPAGKGGDELTACAMACLNGNLFLLDLIAMKGGYEDDNLAAIAELCRFWNASLCRVESNMGDGMFSRLLQPFLVRVHPCAIEDNRSVKRKELRIIEALEPLMNQHRLIVNTRVVHQDAVLRPEDGDNARFFTLFYQMTRITKDPGCLKYDDRIDVVGMAVEYWVQHLGIDQATAMAKHEEALSSRELDEIRRTLGPDAFVEPGKGPPPPNGSLDRLRTIAKARVDTRNVARDRALGRLSAGRRRGPVIVGIPVPLNKSVVH